MSQVEATFKAMYLALARDRGITDQLSDYIFDQPVSLQFYYVDGEAMEFVSGGPFDLVALIQPIYSGEVPQRPDDADNQYFPYILLNVVGIDPYHDGETLGERVRIQVDLYTRDLPYVEVLSLGGQIKALLDRIDLTAFGLPSWIETECLDFQADLISDPRTPRVVMDFRVTQLA